MVWAAEKQLSFTRLNGPMDRTLGRPTVKVPPPASVSVPLAVPPVTERSRRSLKLPPAGTGRNLHTPLRFRIAMLASCRRAEGMRVCATAQP